MYHSLTETHDARVLYVDMNAFFASVEQQYDPSLRGKPCAVVSHRTNSGTVLAASYEAKALGISTGTKLRDAWQHCPSLATREPNPSLYRSTHKRFMAVLQNICGPELEARSIDEAAIYLSSNWCTSEKARELALEIKDQFSRVLGPFILCSIGIAPNSFLAKLATDLQKPDGLVEITLDNTPQVLDQLELTDLPGIAHRNAARLADSGITTPLEFYQSPQEELRRRFGMWGEYWWWRLHGFEVEGSTSLMKSMSHEHVLKRWPSHLSEIQPIITRMADHLIHRLRKNHYQCRSLGVSMRLESAHPIWLEHHFDASTDCYKELLGAIYTLLTTIPEALPGRVRKIAICFNQLTLSANGLQIDLFTTRIASEQVSRALEDIRARFGFQSIQFGNVATLDHRIAQEQLGFGHIKDGQAGG